MFAAGAKKRLQLLPVNRPLVGSTLRIDDRVRYLHPQIGHTSAGLFMTEDEFAELRCKKKLAGAFDHIIGSVGQDRPPPTREPVYPSTGVDANGALGWLALDPTTSNLVGKPIGGLLPHPSIVTPRIISMLRHEGFCFETPLFYAGVVGSSDWGALAGTWSRLAPDRYMADGGSYRFRRYATLRWNPEENCFMDMPYMPLFKAGSYNSFAGGIKRFFGPVYDAVLRNPIFARALCYAFGVFGSTEAAAGREQDWFIEVDQYRIVAGDGMPGKPAPEGAHTDGTSYFMLMLMERNNVDGAETTILDAKGNVLARRTLTQPGDVVLVDDARVMHDASPITSKSAAGGHRDVLHLSFTNRLRPGAIERRFGLAYDHRLFADAPENTPRAAPRSQP